ncbi:MAG TPA: hypothetical protein VNC22_20270 [Sporichthya sp.]|jgi:hypothetical protein|nr:hypothetical protein [Sporichthya sp.]
MHPGGRTAGFALAAALAAVPFAAADPAQASCGNLRTTAAGAGAALEQVVFTAADDPSPTPCPSVGPLGPTSDDEDGGGSDGAKAGIAVAAVVLIVGGLVLRRRAARH